MKEDHILLNGSRTVKGSLETTIQWNTQGISTSKLDLLKIIDNTKPIETAVQETFLANDVMIKLSNYNVITKLGHFNRRYQGGVALFIYSVCPFNQVNINSDLQIIAARLHVNSKLLTIACIYIPGSKVISPDSLTSIIDQLPRPFILLGDQNGHNPLLGGSSKYYRGRLIESMITSLSVTLISLTTDHQPTCLILV